MPGRVGVKSAGSQTKKLWGSEIEQAVIEKAAILTGIGIGTAFGLLVLLMVIISIVGWLSTHLLDRAERKSAERSAEAEAEAHDKALAAFVAVTALLSSSSHLRDIGGTETG